MAADCSQPPQASNPGDQFNASPPKAVALFDATHGQANWAQTGFSSREMHTNFVNVTETLCRQGCRCLTSHGQPLSARLATATLLVVPPPTGRFDPQKQCWLCDRTSLFTPDEIHQILAFLQNGGRLLACSYRFGDSFTQTNLRDLFGPLGCLVNDDVVIDLHTLQSTHPLQAHFDTFRNSLPLAWSRPEIQTVRWRAMATFTILPGVLAAPLVLSPGGRCIAFDRAQRRVSFRRLPIAVAGLHGRGRYALFGGPHAFETGTFGLFSSADNARFLRNVLQWLLSNQPAGLDQADNSVATKCEWQMPNLADDDSQWTRVDYRGNGTHTIAATERFLRQTGILKALSRARWMP